MGWRNIDEELPERGTKCLVCNSKKHTFTVATYDVDGVPLWFLENTFPTKVCKFSSYNLWKPLEEAQDDIYNAVVSGLDSLVSSGKFDGFLAHPDVHYRGKTLPSIDNKLQRNIDAERPLEKVFNDLIGIRIIIEDYTVWEKVKPKIIASNATIVDLRNGKVPDDGYRAVHVYFQADHKHYPIELQFVSEKDSLFNSWQHDYFYKNSQLSPEIGLKLRNLYDLGIITTEQDYRNELHKCSTNTIVEHTIISGTKLVANRFGVKGSVGYVPKSNEELITLYKELSKEMKQNHIDVGISIVKGNGFAEFQPCTIYNTYSSFYDAIFYDLLKK